MGAAAQRGMLGSFSNNEDAHLPRESVDTRGKSATEP